MDLYFSGPWQSVFLKGAGSYEVNHLKIIYFNIKRHYQIPGYYAAGKSKPRAGQIRKIEKGLHDYCNLHLGHSFGISLTSIMNGEDILMNEPLSPSMVSNP
jgi:hypothetical protein